MTDPVFLPSNDTRHSHGAIRHDHPGGNIPHEHNPGDPLYSEPRHPGGYGSAVSAGTGIAVAILGGLGMLAESSNHSACSSALIQSLDPGQCQAVNLIWTGSLLAVIAGAVLTLAAAITGTRH